MRLVLVLSFLFVGLNVVAGTLEAADATGDSRVRTRMAQEVAPILTNVGTIEQSGSGGNFITNFVNSFTNAVATVWSWTVGALQLLFKMITWNYTYLNGSFVYFKWFFLWPLSLVFMISVLMPLAKGIF